MPSSSQRHARPPGLRLVPSAGARRPAALRVVPAPANPLGPEDDAVLLDCVGPVDGAHVLVIGGAVEVMCGLIRRGCAAATELQLGDRTSPGPAEIAVVPRLRSPVLAAEAVALARRVLEPCGRIVLRDPSEPLARTAAAMLRAAGFSGVRVRVLAAATLVTAECPWFGPGVRSAGMLSAGMLPAGALPA